MMSMGYFQVALGKKYIDESCAFIWSLRQFKDNYPVSILVKKEDYDYAFSKNVFDNVVVLDENDPLFGLCGNNHDKYCIFPRVSMLKYVPYSECIVIDTDVFCTHSPDKAWESFRDKGQPFNCIGMYNDPAFHWSNINKINKKLEMNIPCVHGGVFYLNKNFGKEDLETFFLHVLYAFLNYDNLGFVRAFEEREFDRKTDKGAMTDEIMFGYAMSKMKLTLLDFSLHSVMTFEIDNYLINEITFPNHRQTHKEYCLLCAKLGKDKPIIMPDPIPFVHIYGYGHQKEDSSQKIKNLIKNHCGAS
jgi:hypothetical protein